MPIPKGNINPLGTRFVFKLKTDNNNNIIKYKARLVIQGFKQVKNLDYLETFAITARPEAIKIALIIGVYLGFEIKQYDIKNAFIYSKIDTDIYIKLPTENLDLLEYILSNSKTTISKQDINNYKVRIKSKDYNINQDLILKLEKALYGLKQSPRL